ncbi:MAG: hypothetical protein JO288_19000 [Hyphomicrobiales bacterium]|nr:hypothetical protein [Hyphomicrobiales bacterium]
MAYFLCKLIPPRKTFIEDMTAEERALMGEHAAYWRPHVEGGLVIAMGPVVDPAGGYGVMIAAVASHASLRALQADDPVIRANCGFSFETFAMPALATTRLEPLASAPSVTP